MTRSLRPMLLVLALAATSHAAAQTRTARDTVSAYGARLAAPGLPATLNERRVNSRVPSRLDTRLGLRIERYRTNAVGDPTASYRTANDDRSRAAPVVAPSPAPDLNAE